MKHSISIVDWQLFWLFETIALSVPTLVTIIGFRDGPYLSSHKASVLGLTLIALTVLNLIVNLILSNRANPRSHRRAR